MQNENPEIFDISCERINLKLSNGKVSPTVENIFEILRDIKDPEHSYSLEVLKVINSSSIKIYKLDSQGSDQLPLSLLDLDIIEVTFTPTIPHCSMAGIIGLCIYYQLKRYLKNNFWFRILIEKDKHVNYEALNKQLNDKERVAAALENGDLLNLITELVPTI